MAVSCDPSTLANAARCFSRCNSGSTMKAIKTYLLCQMSSGSAPGAPTNPDFANNSVAGNTIFTWTNPSPAGTTNEVWKSTDGVNFVLFATVAGGVSQSIDASTMADGDFWTYKVRSCSGASCSAFTSPIAVSKNFVVPDALTVILPTLVLAYGPLSFTGCFTATSISLPILKALKGDFSATIFLTNLAALVSFSAPKLVTIDGGFDCQGVTALTSVSLPLLTDTGAEIDFSGSTALATLSLPSLVNCGVVGVFDFSLNNCSALTNFTAPNLAHVGNNFILNGTGAFNLALPALLTVGQQLTASLSGITGLAFPVLTSVGTIFAGGGSASLVNVFAPALITVGNDINFANSTNLATFTLTNLQTVGGLFQVNGCSKLAALTLSSFTALGQDFIAHTCPLLTTLSIPNLIFTDTFGIDFSACGLVVGNSAAGTGVDGVLRRAVVSGLTSDSILLNGGTNAPPDASGLADKATLITAGNGVVTN